MRTMSEEPSLLADGAPLEQLCFEGAPMKFSIRWRGATPRRQVDAGTSAVRGSTHRRETLRLKRGTLKRDGIPFLRDDESTIVGLCFVEEDDIGQLDPVRSGVGSNKGLEKQLKSGTVQVSRMSGTIASNHLDHLQPNDDGTDNAGDLGDGLSFLLGEFEGLEFLGYAADGFAIDVGHLLD